MSIQYGMLCHMGAEGASVERGFSCKDVVGMDL
jgi:hypothetical protein